MKTLITLFIAFVIAGMAAGQHPHHHQPADTTKKTQKAKPIKRAAKKDPVKTQHHGTQPMQHDHRMQHSGHDVMQMPSHAYSRNLPMNRNASGTFPSHFR